MIRHSNSLKIPLLSLPTVAETYCWFSMRNPLIAIIFSLCVFVLFAEGRKEIDHGEKLTWEEYKAKFGKSYKTKALDDAHKDAFIKSQNSVKGHNAKHQRGEKSYTLGLNQLSDLLPNEKNIRGHIPRRGARPARQVVDNSDFSCSNYVPDPAAVIPAAIDYRTMGYVTPVKDQGECGSCYSFSSTGALEGQLFKKTNQLTSLSEQNIVDCSGAQGNGGCNGGRADWTFNYVSKNGGISSESSYPYTGTQQTCSSSNPNVAGSDISCAYIENGNEAALKAAVATQGPISMAIHTDFPGFQDIHGDGVFNDTICYSPPQPEDHAVLIVGYGTDAATNLDYWIIKNSWSTAWGDQGYFKLLRGKNCLGVANDAVYPIV